MAIENSCVFTTAEHFSFFLYELYISVVHKLGCLQAHKWKGKKDIKANFGCGSHPKDGFLNVDFCRSADLRIDLRQPIPLPSKSCSLIFSEHFLEHLAYPEETGQFIRDCYRILQPGGEIILSVPDTEWPLQDYVRKETAYLDACEQHHWHPGDCSTFMEHINYHFRQRWNQRSGSDFQCHRFAYDFETLEKILMDNGFNEIVRKDTSPFGSEHRNVGSLIVHAFRPSSATSGS